MALASAARWWLRRSPGARLGRGGLVGRVNGGDEGGEFRPGRDSLEGCSTFGLIYSPNVEHPGGYAQFRGPSAEVFDVSHLCGGKGRTLLVGSEVFDLCGNYYP